MLTTPDQTVDTRSYPPLVEAGAPVPMVAVVLLVAVELVPVDVHAVVEPV